MILRPATPADIDFFYGLYMHPEINPYLLYEPMPLEDFEPIFRDLQQQGALYIIAEGNAEIGMVKLLPNRYRTAHVVYLGGFALHPAYKGQGLGQKTLRCVMDYALSQGFTRIELSVAAHNTPAIRLYERCGFVQEGILRRYTYLAASDEYIDEIMMAFLDEHIA